MRYVGGLALTTLVAGLATAPIAAYQFNRIALFSVIANLAALPLVGIVVMPMAVVALIAMPFGLETYALGIMGEGIKAVMGVARYVAQLPGVTQLIFQQSMLTPLLIVGGLLWLCLWHKLWRFAGFGLILCGFFAIPQPPLPDVLVGAEGKLFGIRTSKGRLVLNTARAEKFLGERWLQKFGDATDLTDAAARDGISCDSKGCIGKLSNGMEIALVKHSSILREECARAQIVVVSFRYKGQCPGAKIFLTQTELRSGGVHAIYLGTSSDIPGPKAGISHHISRSVFTHRGIRPWTRREKWIPKPKSFRRENFEPKNKRHPEKKPEQTPSKKDKSPPLQVKI
ncbi:MAG: ComEC/Rec2 family competence protein [Hyphomicrobiales bacterium]